MGERTSWIPAYIAIGSNLDDPRAQVEQAFVSLASLKATRLVARSRVYGSRPFGPIVQPDFINAAVGVLTRLTPRELLVALKELEVALGRTAPVERWGPRRIDFDLLAYGNVRMEETDLTVPHPGIPQRNFVLYPLADIAPDLHIPGMGVVKELAARVGAQGLQLLS
ncbi:MAG: 2-amino-4-hydroxy-6-hydroxymethyldihydropteridine diphosphokinase [Gammaproteobacteria bacterium]|nr:2-amino-4-hydroxy-6-hydroxymethyldihydropteridine diphosphokinase [Gammaproteobacteria bacterium]